MSRQGSREDRWRAKLAAWTHDPAEKAFVLFRDPAGHEAGTARRLREILFPDGLPQILLDAVKQADEWAAAADRPQFPRTAGHGYDTWAQVRFDQEPVLIHPLSGQQVEVSRRFSEIHPGHIKAVSLDHFGRWRLSKGDGTPDYERTLLAFWRFGPVSPAPELGAVWELLPADTRVPDHTIWTHLDLTAALAGALVADPKGGPALLVVSFGPVQEFIAQARSTSDLWAGSHLLSRLAWEGLRVVCEAAGPDAVIYPQLRRVPIVDLWLVYAKGLPEQWFEQEAWRTAKSDANPLFAATLPNKFVAVVPYAEAKDLARQVEQGAHDWVCECARRVVRELLRAAGFNGPAEPPPACYEQAEVQLAGFPEVHWAVVPWSLIVRKDGGLDVTALRDHLAVFHPDRDPDNFLESATWKVLCGEIKLDGAAFYVPNPGVLYPAIYGLADRAHAAAKSVRRFEQQPQAGYRCSLCGEREWLAIDRSELELPPGRRTETLWTRIAARRPSWARRGEHLCALCALKRTWPDLFAREMADRTGLELQRYVVSTHTLALSTSIERWLDRPDRPALPDELRRRLERVDRQAALPAGLAQRLAALDKDARTLARRLPVLLDELAERTDEEGQAERARIESLLRDVLGHRPEIYYALLLMDGDRMGAWLSGGGATGEVARRDVWRLHVREVWHPRIRREAERRFGAGPVRSYLEAARPLSPAGHAAISAALNAFSLRLARVIVEEACKGKLLYAGGDDVLAMVAVDDLLDAMLLLRLAYSGIFPGTGVAAARQEVLGRLNEVLGRLDMDLECGFVRLRRGLHRVMGSHATASMGVVVAHHTAPLGVVLRALREAEEKAKKNGGRNAFCVRVLKGSGGAVELTSPWFCREEPEPVDESPIGALMKLRGAFGAGWLSRRASFLVQEWLAGLPSLSGLKGTVSPSTYEEMLRLNLAYQFERQGRGDADFRSLAGTVAGVSCRVAARIGASPTEVAARLLSVAEFLARESRRGVRAATRAEGADA